MAKLKTISALFVCILLSAVATGGGALAADDTIDRIASAGAIRICFAEENPFTMKNPTTGKWEGLTKDMATDLAASMEVQLVDVDASFATVIQNLQADKCDIVAAALYATVKRAKVMIFSKPFAFDTTTAYVRNDAKYSKYAELDEEGKVIGVRAGTQPEDFAKRFFKKATVKPYLADTNVPILTDLAAKRLDAFWDGEVSLGRFLAANPQYPVRAIGDVPMTPTAIVWGIKPTDFRFQQLVNTWIDGYISSGKMVSDWTRWFGVPYVRVN